MTSGVARTQLSRIACILPIAALYALLSACVEYHETLTLNRDGSGRLSMRIEIDETVVQRFAPIDPGGLNEQSMTESINILPGLQVTRSATERRNDHQTIRLELKFDSTDSLLRLNDAGDYRRHFGNVSFSETASGDLALVRQVQLAESKSPAIELPAEVARTLFGNYRWRYQINMPTKIRRTESPGGQVAIEGEQVTWEFSLAELLKGSQRLEVVAAKPGRGAAGIFIGIGLMLTAVAALWLLRGRK